MITSVIIDDEQQDIAQLKNSLNTYCQELVTVLYCADNFEDGIASIVKYKPQLVFLDVQLTRGRTGFDLLTRLCELKINLEVIFTTSYDQYAIKACQFSAIYYLLKPINSEQLIEAVQKADNKVTLEQRNRKIQSLIDFLNKEKNTNLVIEDAKQIHFLSLNDIIRCESEISYTHFFLNNKPKIVSSKTLGDYEKLLKEFGFSRVHQSHLINRSYIAKFYHIRQGGVVVLKNGHEINVSVWQKKEFLETIKNDPSIKFIK